MTDTQTTNDQFLYGTEIRISVHQNFVKFTITNEEKEQDVFLPQITIDKVMTALGEAMMRRMRIDAIYMEHS
jgi:hypothetical protein